nr:hypothetical protein [Tanacetum cinerariifolium]
YAEDASPIAQSPEYVPESDFEMHPEDDDDKDLRRILLIILPIEEMTAMTRRTLVHMPAWTNLEVARLLAISSPPASPLSLWSLPPPLIPFPPLPPILSPPSPILSPAPPPSPIRIALGPRYEVGESSSAAAARPAGGFRVDYDLVATVDREIMRDPEREEADCDFRVTEDRSYEIYRDFRVKDSLTRIDHSPTGTGDSFAGTGYHFTGTAGTCWGPYTATATRGGWWQCID